MKSMTVVQVLCKGIFKVKLNYCDIKASNNDKYVINSSDANAK